MDNVEGNPISINDLPPDDFPSQPVNEELMDSAVTNEKDSIEEPINANSEEVERLGGKNALPTLAMLSIGPFIAQIANALYGIGDTMWVTKSIGDIGMTAISTYSNFDTVNRAFGSFLGSGATSVISTLFGSGQGHDAGQLVCDLIRIAFIFAILIPLIFVPITRPVAYWFGASTDVVELGREYILPLLYGSIIPCLFLLGLGCLQAEGRAWLYTIAQLVGGFFNLVVFDPLFLFGFKMGIKGAAFATNAGELIPMTILFYYYFKGHFGIKLKWSYLLQPFCSHTWQALKIGASQFVLVLSFSLPGVVLRKYLGMACTSVDTYNDVMAAYNTLLRFYMLVFSVSGSLILGFVPAASYSYGARRFRRVMFLLLHSFWISLAWCVVCMVFTVGFPRISASIFSTSKGYLDWSEVILRNSTLFAFLTPIPVLIQALLQAQQLGGKATTLSLLTQLIPIPIFSIIMYYSDKTNPGRIFYAYAAQQILGVIFSIPFGYTRFFQVIDDARVEKETRENEVKLQDV